MSDMNKSLRHDPGSGRQIGPFADAGALPCEVRPKIALRPIPPSADHGFTVHFVLTALRQWWRVALPAGLRLAGAAASGVFWLFQPLYQAEAWFLILDRAPYLAFESRDDGRSKKFFETQIETIRSPFVLGPVVKRPEVAKIPEIAEQVDKVAWLAKQIKVASIGESEYFKIFFSNPDPKAAATVVDAVSEAYFKLRDQSDAERNQRVIELLQREMDKRSKDVLRLRDNLRSLAKEATGKDPYASKVESDVPQRHPLADLESRWIAVQVEQSVLDARIRACEEELALAEKQNESKTPAEGELTLTSPREIAYRDATADKIVESSQAVQQQKAMIAAKQAHLQKIEEFAAKGKEDSAYVKLAKEIEGDQRELERLREEMRPLVRREAELDILAKRSDAGMVRIARRREELAKMRSDREAGRVMEQMLRERVEEQRKNVQQSSGDTMELTFKRDELARAEQVFELIAQRALQLQTERGAPARIIAMQEKTAVPAAPAVAFPWKNLGMAVLPAFFFPFALAVFWERLVKRVGDSQTFERESSVAVLGEITHLPARAPVHAGASSRLGREIQLFEESIDSLRTSLCLSEDLSGLRVVAVASAANHEGKTSVAAQLAVSFARASGEPTLLIDGDMRSPDVHRVFQIPLEPGLSQVLSGKCGLEEAIVTSWSANVHLLPAGKLAGSPHKLLGNGAWKSLMAQIPSKYRYVVIDTPPVLAASEAMVLTKAADATLVCMMRDVSRLDQVRKTIERLAATGSRPVGTVLNGVTARYYASRYGGYAYGEK